MNRRRFAFCIGLILFNVNRFLRAEKVDHFAADLMEWTEASTGEKRERWRANANRTWKWYERQTLLDGTWKTSGLTTPVHRRKEEFHQGEDGYLDESLVPDVVRESTTRTWKKLAKGRTARGAFVDGQPPSQWIRSLNAPELRLWLRTVRLPEVGVSEMTFWTHLTRDHSFSAERIRGLNEAELAKLHSAAHYGF